ncbi:MAG: hypothetical protein P4L51_28265 [Puia sp.]|nr:hypothetical protein [Puia sp.]
MLISNLLKMNRLLRTGQIAFFVLTWGQSIAQISVTQGRPLASQDSLRVGSVFFQQFGQVSQRFPEEKIHLQLDRDRYFAGDTIWFRSYFFLGGVPGACSQSMRVELYKDSTLVESKSYPVGFAGELELPENLAEGYYIIQAYTPWMANFDPTLFYRRTVQVYQLRRANEKRLEGPIAGSRMKVKSSPATNTQMESADTSQLGGKDSLTLNQSETSVIPHRLDVQFLPEGGASIEEVYSRVAFIATDDWGNPDSIQGWIVNNTGDTVARLETAHEGMGSFDYIPHTGRIYYAHIHSPFGDREVPLPAAQPDGISIQVMPMEDGQKGVKITLRAPGKSRYFNHTLHILGSMFGNPVFEATAHITETLRVFDGIIPTDHFVNGLLRISVIDEDSLPLAERVVFIRPKPLFLNPQWQLDTLDISRRGLNGWSLHFPDSVKGSLSISVTDADALPDLQHSDNIFTDLLLTEDLAPGNRTSDDQRELRGRIPDPGYYFQQAPDSAQRDAYLDLVMMTHGWRSFGWKEIRNPASLPAIRYPMGEALNFPGKALFEFGHKPIRNKELTILLQSPSIPTQIVMTQADSGGHFYLSGLQFFDTATAFFQINEQGNPAKNIRLLLDPALRFPPSYPMDEYSSMDKGLTQDTIFRASAGKKAEVDREIHRFNQARELKEIVIKSDKDSPRLQLQELDDRYAFGMFHDTQGYGFDFIHHPEYAIGTNVIKFLEGRIPSLVLKGGGIVDTSLSYRGGGCPALFLDEMPATFRDILDVPMTNIAYVKFISPPFMGAPFGGANGALVVYTKHGEDLLGEATGLNRLTLKGYAVSRQFYSPLYDKEDDGRQDSLADYRITLAWKPYVPLNSEQVARIRFFNNDHCKQVRVTVEGMDNSGKLLHFEKIVQGNE